MAVNLVNVQSDQHHDQESDEMPYLFKTRVYKGITLTKIFLESSIEALQTFDVRHDDVWVVTYPKSGTHWMMEVVSLICTDGHPEKIDRTTYGLISMIDQLQKLPKTRAEELANPPDMTPMLDKVRDAPSPRVIASHLQPQFLPPDLLKKGKLVYIARNPKDVVHSYFHFLNSMKSYGHPSWAKMLADFMDGDKIRWGSWVDHVKKYWELRHEENVLFISYEDMKQDPRKYVKQVANHIGRPLSDEAFERVVECSSFNGMSKTYQKATKDAETNGQLTFAKGGGIYNFMRKGTRGQWKNQFTVAQNEAFDRWYWEKMGDSDLTFSFE